VPEGYFVAQSTSYVNWSCSGVRRRRSTETASRMFRNGVKIYPLTARDDPPDEVHQRIGPGVQHGPRQRLSFYQELHRVIDREPVDIIDPETRGLIASIGIRKGKPFEPDQHLRDSSSIPSPLAMPRPHPVLPDHVPDNYLYEGSHWKRGSSAAITGSSWTRGSGGERNLDARTAVFYMRRSTPSDANPAAD